MLVGRSSETARLDELVTPLRAGASAVLVIAGDAGIGKSSLLDYAVRQADGLQVLRAAGAESEQNLPFAGLASLAGPVLDHLDALPERQRTALAGALAVGPAMPADRFAVCAATLGLLSAAAAERPVLAVIDDAHWLDAASAQALEFTARRLGAEGIGLLIAIRTGAAAGFDPARMETLTLSGLGPAESAELLAAGARPLALGVAQRLISGCGGNPLAMLELSASLTEQQLAGAASLPEPLPVTDALRQALDQRLAAVGPTAREVLLLAAADTAADLTDLAAACDALSLDMTGLADAQEAGLVRIEAGRVEFSHPLLRSAAYHGATVSDRRAAHRVLADRAISMRDQVRRAWHLAAAATGPDEKVAVILDEAAAAAVARNAFVAASRASQRAAELTADRARQLGRWQVAGLAAHQGGDFAAAGRMLSRAIELAADPIERADAQILLAHATVWNVLPITLHYQLSAQAAAVLPFSASRAATMHALAALPCFSIGRIDLGLQSAVRATDLASRTGSRSWLISNAALAVAQILTGERIAGQRLMGTLMAELHAPRPDLGLSFLRMMCARALIWCEDFESAAALILPTVDQQRASGQLADLAYGLAIASELRFQLGDWSRAYADATEAIELGTEFPTTTDISSALVCAARIEAATGARGPCQRHLELAQAIAEPRGHVSIPVHTAAVLGLLELSAGDYRQAAASLAGLPADASKYRVTDPCVLQWEPDYIESLARLGRRSEAAAALSMLESEAIATGSQWAAATAARCAGLLESPAPAIPALEHAVKLADAATGPFDRARARLYLGEALRRAKHRGAARNELEQAMLDFRKLGAEPWADRAATELRATGDAVARPAARPIHAKLTPQELRVALQVADGLSNKEVAAQLFLSPKTVEVHLSHIYDKLGVRSRTALVRLVNAGAVEASG